MWRRIGQTENGFWVSMISVRGQKLWRLSEFRASKGEVTEGAPQKVTAIAEQTFGAAFMGLKRNRVLLVLPEPGEHSPTER
jgi:hypothetical protein